MADILEDLSCSCLTLDASNESEAIRYEDSDVMNALIIFSHVISNYSIHRAFEKKTHLGVSLRRHVRGAKAMKAWFQEATGIDPAKFYQKSPSSK